jgi:hypothetical protein
MPSQLNGDCRVWVAAYWWFRTEAFAPFEAVARQPRRIKDLELRFGAFLTPFHALWPPFGPPFGPLLLISSMCLRMRISVSGLCGWRNGVRRTFPTEVASPPTVLHSACFGGPSFTPHHLT